MKYAISFKEWIPATLSAEKQIIYFIGWMAVTKAVKLMDYFLKNRMSKIKFQITPERIDSWKMSLQ